MYNPMYSGGGYLTADQQKKLPTALKKAIRNYKRSMEQMMKGGYMPTYMGGGKVGVSAMMRHGGMNPIAPFAAYNNEAANFETSPALGIHPNRSIIGYPKVQEGGSPASINERNRQYQLSQKERARDKHQENLDRYQRDYKYYKQRFYNTYPYGRIYPEDSHLYVDSLPSWMPGIGPAYQAAMDLTSDGENIIEPRYPRSSTMHKDIDREKASLEKANEEVRRYRGKQSGGTLDMEGVTPPAWTQGRTYYNYGSSDGSYARAMQEAARMRKGREYHENPGVAARELFGIMATPEGSAYQLPGGTGNAQILPFPRARLMRRQAGGLVMPQMPGGPQMPQGAGDPSQARMQQLAGVPPMPPQGQGQGQQQAPSQEELMQLAQAVAAGDQNAMQILEQLPPQIRQMVMELAKKMSGAQNQQQAQMMYGGSMKKGKKKSKKKKAPMSEFEKYMRANRK